MYKIIGADQKEYGPVTSQQVRQWLADGRVNGQTRVSTGADWVPLAEVPEFADIFGRLPEPQIAALSQSPPKTSGLAVASLVLGILGIFTCGVTALVGLVLGILSLNRIKRNEGALGGHGVALAGTIVSAIFLLVLPLFAAMLLPALAKAKSRALTIVCANNMRQLSLAMKMYSSDHDEAFAPSANWCDVLQKYTMNGAGVFKCPEGNKSQMCHYAFNTKLSGMYETNVAPNTVMLFETTGGWNQSGGPELMLIKPRHGTKLVVALADGSVQEITAAKIGTLRWDP